MADEERAEQQGDAEETPADDIADAEPADEVEREEADGAEQPGPEQDPPTAVSQPDDEPDEPAAPVSQSASDLPEAAGEEVMNVSDLQNHSAANSEMMSPNSVDAGPTYEDTTDEESPPPAAQARRTSTMSDIPFTDSAILRELQEADEEACRTALLIKDMRLSIDKFQMKKHLTKEDAEKLEKKQSELLKIHGMFEEITRKVQRLVGLAEISSTQFQPSFRELLAGVAPECAAPGDHSGGEQAGDKMQPGEGQADEGKPDEGKPCEGEPGEGMPDEGKPDKGKPDEGKPGEGKPDEGKPGEKQLSVHSADHELDKSTLVSPDQLATIPEREEDEDSDLEATTSDDMLPRVIVCGVEDQMPRIIVCDEKKRAPIKPRKLHGYKNKDGLVGTLTDRLSHSYGMQEKLATENADLEGRRYSLQEELYHKDNTVESLQKQINSLQNNMRLMAKENKVLSEQLNRAVNPQNKQPCNMNRPNSASKKVCPNQLQQYSVATDDLEWQLSLVEQEVKKMQTDIVDVKNDRAQLEKQRKLLQCAGAEPPSRGVGCPAGGSNSRESEKALRELKEQYSRLQDDFKGKLTEVSVLRREIEKQKEIAEQAKDAQEAAEIAGRVAADKLLLLEKDVKKTMGTKEQQMEMDQQLSTAKQRFREAQDELEEMRGLIQDQASQLEDYRNRYLLAQQQVEEQRRQIEVNEMDNNRISEQVTAEIQRVRNQFQEKLAELAPLSDILKGTQLKLQETQQLRAIAERNCEDMAREMQEAKDKAQHYARQLDDSRNNSSLSIEEHGNTKSRLENLEKKLATLKEENAMQKTQIARSEEAAAQSQIRLEEKLHEVAQLMSQLETLREESARQVARTKDRGETMKRSYMNQISELERQLAASRAAAQSAQKDRNEIRQRMQTQINNLNESFEQAQIRIRNLQGNVNFLKTSYSNIFANDNANPLMITDNCECGKF